MSKKIKKTIKKNIWSFKMGRRFQNGLILFLMIGLSAGFIIYQQRHSHTERGQLGVSDTYIGENLADSLDLQLASKATYSSSPLTITENISGGSGYSEQVVSFQVNDDNLTEKALMLTPATPRPTAGYPVIILLHGYVNPHRYDTFKDYLPDMRFYARQGFVVIKPDLRGQGLSKNVGHADSAYFSMAYNTDILSLVSAVTQTLGVNTNDINIWGHSMGAYLGLRAAMLSDKINNVVLLAGAVDSLAEMYLTYIPPSDENNPYAITTRSEVFAKYGTPSENRVFWRDASPIFYRPKITGIIQIHVGLLDNVVPPEFSADLDKTFKTNNIKHQYYVYPDGHSLQQSRPLIYTKSLRLLQSPADNT